MKLVKLLSLIAIFAFALTGAAHAKDHHDHHDRDWWSHHRNERVVFINGGYSYNPYYYDTYYPRPIYYAPRPVYQGSVVDDNVVYDVQRRLRREGYYSGPVDGLIGPGTRGAIAAFQREHGMAPNGRITGSLLDALDLT